MNDIGYFPLGQNYGYYLDVTPKNVLDELKVQIDEIQNNFNIGEKYNDKLAGEIEHEYKIEAKYHTQEYIKYITEQIERESNYYYNQLVEQGYDISKDRNTYLDFSDMWVNYQKKYEYNPIHKHSGLYSFVIWYQIPFTFEQENKITYKSPKNKAHHGDFMFCYPNIRGGKLLIEQLGMQIDKSQEGMMAIFPSNLNHSVNPFYSSNDYRITVAGNIMVQSISN